LLPQTIGPFRNGAIRRIASFILRRAERVFARDAISLEAAHNLMGTRASRAALSYDMAFEVEPIAPASVQIDGLNGSGPDAPPLVGLNVSGLLLAGGYTRTNMFGLKVHYRKLVESVVEFLIEVKNARVLLIPHVYGSVNDLESDNQACEAIFDALAKKYPDRLGVVKGTYRYFEVKHIIGRCDVFVGARMHACIGAMAQSVPTVLIAYSDKFAGMLNTIGCGNVVVDPRRMDLAAMLQAVGHVFEQRDEIRAELERKMPGVKRAIRQTLGEIEIPEPGHLD